MKCSNCDFIVAEKEAAFCPKCGCPLEVEEVVEAVKEPEVVEEKTEVEKEIALFENIVSEANTENSIENKLNTLIGISWGLLITGIINLILFFIFLFGL